MSVSLDRRQFLRTSAGAGLGLVIGFTWSGPGRRAGVAVAAAAEPAASPFAPNAFLRIDPDDTVTVVAKHIEFGQGSHTGLATILCEELDADWAQVRVEAAPADATRYANLGWGEVQGTGGSSAMANSWKQLREAGATGRALLVAAAAAEWGVPAGEIDVERGVVRHAGSGREARFGALVGRAAELPLPAEVRLKDPSRFRLVGAARTPRVDTADKTTGRARFTIDVQEDGMLTALLARPPRFGGRLAKLDDAAARKVAGVVDVVTVARGVAVVAQGFWPAKQGRDALKLEWDDTAAERRGSEELVAEYRALAQRPGAVAASRGDAAAALAGAAEVLEAEFVFPFLAHAPMETLDCVARLEPGRLELWLGSQIPTVDQQEAARAAGLEPRQVVVNTLLAGGSFGRRATADADVAVEAASVAKALGPGRTVKVVWTREDDVRGGRYRPLYVHRIRAARGADGRPLAWEHRIVGQSITAGTPFGSSDAIDPSSVEGARNLPYAIPSFQVELHPTRVGVPPLWWRSVGHTHTAFSTEVVIDELAAAAGEDPIAYRLALLGPEHARLRGVLEAVAKAAGGLGAPGGRARGVAAHESFGSFVAQIAEVSAEEDGMPRVHRVWCAVDCGVAINPDVIRAQMSGGLGFGLGAALHGEIVIEDGLVRTSNFHDYPVLRMSEMPQVEVVIVHSAEPPTGVGEPGTPPIAPAVANAMRSLGGRPVRRLPFRRHLAETRPA